jgi:hypothetical protein
MRQLTIVIPFSLLSVQGMARTTGRRTSMWSKLPSTVPTDVAPPDR